MQFGGGRLSGKSTAHRKPGYLCGVSWRIRLQPGTTYKRGAFMVRVGVLCVKETLKLLYTFSFYAHTTWQSGRNVQKTLALTVFGEETIFSLRGKNGEEPV